MKLSVAIALTLASLISPVVPTWAQTTTSIATAIQFTPPPPPSVGAPTGRPRGGASRGQCPDVAQPLTALVPSTPTPSSLGNAQTVWGLTATAHPTFWFYVPYQLTSETPLEFVLLDEQDNPVYQTLLASASTAPGIVSITLPTTAPALEVGKVYQWYFMIYCGGQDPVFAQGAIQRTTLPSTAPSPDQLPPREQANLYAANGIWFDALTTLATLHRNNPNNGAIATDWSALLQSAGLSNLSQQPFVNCCTPDSQ